MAVPGESPQPTPAQGPRPGPAHPADPARPTPADAAAALAGGAVDPERLRRQVMEILEAPAPTPADRAEQMERAHALLQDALGGEGGPRG